MRVVNIKVQYPGGKTDSIFPYLINIEAIEILVKNNFKIINQKVGQEMMPLT